jgi:predicted phage replisome organizer
MIDMRERKYVKFRVDMYSDTKFKIIDIRPERDLIHYVWNRAVVLAGKVNLEGELYLSKNIPYTIETLAIEFNRDIDQVKLALDVLIELEMLELTEHKIYIVKNFAKHQNIKVKEKNKFMDSEECIKDTEVEVKSEACNKDLESENKISQNKVENVENSDRVNFAIIGNNISAEEIDNTQKYDHIISDKNSERDKIDSSHKDNMPIILETKKSKKTYKRKKNDKSLDSIETEIEDELICWSSDEDGGRTLREGEHVVGQWSF